MIKKIFHQTKPHKIKLIAALSTIPLLLICVGLLNFSNDAPNQNESYKNQFNKDYRIFAVNIPDKIDFAGERIPIEDFDIRERLDRELLVNTYWQSQTLLWIKRSNRWLPIISGILKKNNVPDDFKYLALIESGFTNAISSKGASGFWQFIEPTAKSYGLEINDEVDERYNPEKSTEAACKYFKESYKQFNSWTMVAASFNMGLNGLFKQTEKQKSGNYYDLALNDETSRYIFRIAAAKEIISRPADYGFLVRNKDLYPAIPFTSLKVDSSITDMVQFSQNQGINYKLLKILNPWLRSDKLTNPNKKSYFIKIPKGDIKNYNWLLEADEEIQKKDSLN